jgi:vancomycin permeability regulator SanA
MENEKINIFVLAGGINNNGKVYDFVKLRLDKAIEVYKKNSNQCRIFCVGGGTYHKPPILDSNNYVIHESTSCAQYLVNNNIPEHDIIRDWSSYDTIANAFFSFTNFIIPLKINNIILITSDFHMDRVKLIFNYIKKLCNSNINIKFIKVESKLNLDILALRNKREKNSFVKFNENIIKKYNNLNDFTTWLFTIHKSYKAIIECETLNCDNIINKTY